MEVQDACGALLELVALPRRVLGLASNVHVSLLQKVQYGRAWHVASSVGASRDMPEDSRL